MEYPAAYEGTKEWRLYKIRGGISFREKGGFFSFRIDSRRCFEGEEGVMNSKDNRKRKEEGSDHVGERDEIFRDAVLGVRYEI